ncbi:MAG: hypothetical protein H6739_26580 [Alphaproteobacteria bacterium]|nr:hypothetical protein [Alphaproteobacteria bacterium]
MDLSSLVDRAGFLTPSARRGLLQGWAAALEGGPPPEPPALPEPWPAVAAGVAEALGRWRGLAVTPEARARLLEDLVTQLHRADTHRQRHPDRPEPPLDHLGVEALLDALSSGPGGEARYGALRGQLGRADPETLRQRALQLARADHAARLAAWERDFWAEALAGLVPTLERKRRALGRIGEALGWGRAWLGLGADWSAGFFTEARWRALEETAARLAEEPALQQLAETLGRWERQAAKAHSLQTTARVARAGHGGRSEVRGLTRGAELERLTPGALAWLAAPETEPLFYLRLAERSLLTYELDSPATLDEPRRRVAPGGAARGPIVLALDTSASMQGAPEQVAKAMTLAVLRVALREGRPCRLIGFSSAHDLDEIELTALPAALPALLDFLARRFGGGTEPGPAVARAVATAAPGADLLLVSDGVFAADDRLREALAARPRGLRVHALVVGEATATVDFADAVWAWRPGARFDEGGLALLRGLSQPPPPGPRSGGPRPG